MTGPVGPAHRIVILGASHAGLAVATELRSAGFAGELALCGAEPLLPYHRPQLSKECLGSDRPEPKPIRAADFYKSQAIAVRLGVRALALDTNARRLELSDGSVLGYDRLVLATGARARALPRSVDPEGVALRLRDRADWLRLDARMTAGTRLVLIGGGLIGLELAVAARRRGMQVTVIEAGPRLMARSLYPALASHALERLKGQGIAFRIGAQVDTLGPDEVRLADGTAVASDIVLAAIGSAPRTELASAAGLACGDGILTDAWGRTSDGAIHALGDCALWQAEGAAQRHESIAATQAQARAVAAGLLGRPAPAEAPLRLWSTQGDLRFQMSGPVLPEARERIERTEDGGLLLRATLGDEVIAVQALNAARPFAAAIGDLGSTLSTAGSL